MADKTPVEAIVGFAIDESTKRHGRPPNAESIAKSRPLLEATARGYLAAIEAAGYRIVDLEPTKAMIHVALDAEINHRGLVNAVRAALAAAPTWGGKDG